ncbi:hypothetical protein COCON_G00100850 [Conger conger]|uniref:Ig-like domain-containing protein n=1 Tax=Conger conger TaxID=82655 RepID=A0A9Q1HXD0_CONCO|nr:hypothetical protein COCON_G00100850 [Conger conger]
MVIKGVCVSAQSNVLNSIVGETVTLPAAVKDTGFLLKAGSGIATVVSHSCQITNYSYSARLRWDPSSGLFSLRGLRTEDSGDYTVQDSERGRYCETQLHTSSPQSQHPLSLPLEIEENSAPYSCVAVNPVSKKTVIGRPEEHCFESVWKPHIKTSAAQGGRSCSLQCSVPNGRELTLSWRTERETLSHTRDPNLSTLSLTLEIEASNSTYTCVATNPVSEEGTAFLPTQVTVPMMHCCM